MDIVIQVNGRWLVDIRVNPGLTPQELEALALANEAVRTRTAGREIRKVIVVPGRLVNIIVDD